MRKLSFAAAIVMALGGACLAGSASAAPGAPIGVTEAAEGATTVGMHHRMVHRRMMHRRMHHRRMVHHRMMHRRMHHRRMMHRRMHGM